MKLFVAGEAAPDTDDFSETIPGELVRFPVEPCDCPGCGAERSMYGLASHGATSVMMVRDMEVDAAVFRQLLWDSLEQGGWVTAGNSVDEAWVEEFATDHIEAASHLPTGQPMGILHSPLAD